MIHELLICDNQNGTYGVRIDGGWLKFDCTSKDSVLSVVLEEMERWERL